MTEFRARLRAKAGSIDEYGNILCRDGFGVPRLATAGYLDINVPVSCRRWATYLAHGWEPRSYLLDLTNDTATGRLHRDPPHNR